MFMLLYIVTRRIYQVCFRSYCLHTTCLRTYQVSPSRSCRLLVYLCYIMPYVLAHYLITHMQLLMRSNNEGGLPLLLIYSTLRSLEEALMFPLVTMKDNQVVREPWCFRQSPWRNNKQACASSRRRIILAHNQTVVNIPAIVSLLIDDWYHLL